MLSLVPIIYCLDDASEFLLRGDLATSVSPAGGVEPVTWWRFIEEILPPMLIILLKQEMFILQYA